MGSATADLTAWAVEARSPGDWPDPSEAGACSVVQHAPTVWQSTCRDLRAHGLITEGLT